MVMPFINTSPQLPNERQESCKFSWFLDPVPKSLSHLLKFYQISNLYCSKFLRSSLGTCTLKFHRFQIHSSKISKLKLIYSFKISTQ